MNNLKNYAIVTGAYWGFMLTDGALRMLVLLFFHKEGYTPVQLAFLFLLYEFFGIVTNLFGGWLANRFGLKMTLVCGLLLQSGAILMLSFLNPAWALSFAVAYVMAAQALSGIAKDLTKMSSKTAVKFLVPEDQGAKLFKWVAALTGSKNSIKGIGFFFGAFLLQTFGFEMALWLMASGVGLIFIASMIFLPKEIGKTAVKNKFRSVFSQGRNINILSFARVFLFGARDIWFVVGVPVFLVSVFHWNFNQTGAFMAIWVILYGIIQSIAPKLIHRRTKGNTPDGRIATELAVLLTVVMSGIVLCLYQGWIPSISLVVGLFIFGVIFAVNSSVHSFLILHYAEGDKAAINVGFYYMANAFGRLIGTLLSGILYQLGGINACLSGAAVFLLITSIISIRLPRVRVAKN